MISTATSPVRLQRWGLGSSLTGNLEFSGLTMWNFLEHVVCFCCCFFFEYSVFLPSNHRLAGLVVKASASRAEDPGFESRLRRDFSGSSHTGDLKIGTPVATLLGAWHHRVSAGTGRPGVSILWLGEVESLICSFYLSVASRKIVWADPFLRYTSLLLGR